VDGNLKKAFTGFPSQHKCNKYCKYYGLKQFTPPLTPWQKMDLNAQRLAKELADYKESEAADAETSETGEITEGGHSRKRAKRK